MVRIVSVSPIEPVEVTTPAKFSCSPANAILDIDTAPESSYVCTVSSS